MSQDNMIEIELPKAEVSLLDSPFMDNKLLVLTPGGVQDVLYRLKHLGYETPKGVPPMTRANAVDVELPDGEWLRSDYDHG